MLPTKEQGQKLIKWMQSQKFRVLAENIVFIRDASPDNWSPRTPHIDYWNCAAVVVKNTGEVLLSNEGTSLPGRYWELNPMNDDGCFRIAADYQHQDGWQIGTHRGYPALIHYNPLLGYRDKNQDFVSESSEECIINAECRVDIHACNGTDGGDTIDRWSAGCLVRRYWDSHLQFMDICQNSGRDKFDVTVVKGTTLASFKG